MAERLIKALLWLSIAAAIFLAFAWPAVVSSDPAGHTFEIVAKSTLAAFFASLAALLVLRLRRMRGS